MDKNYLGAFPRPSTSEWAEEIRKSVKDPAELSKLVWDTGSGFALNAFYREEDLGNITAKDLTFNRGRTFPEIRQVIYTDKIMAANQFALKALENGADSIEFRGAGFNSDNELKALFKGIHLDWFPARFNFGESNISLLYLLIEYYREAGYNTAEMSGSLHYDPLHALVVHGNYDHPKAETTAILKALLQTAAEELPGYRILYVDGAHYANSGATPAEELAFTLAHIVEYFDILTDAGFEAAFIARKMQVNLGIGPDHLLEIAKFRAFDWLLHQVAEAYHIPQDLPVVNATTAAWNKTIYDSHNNLLRATAESMAAITGGCDAITVMPFNDMYKWPDEPAYRWSRNILLILKEEARLHYVNDAAAGSYYLEYATQKIAEQAWEMFRGLMQEGGFIKALENKSIQKRTEQSALVRKQEFTDGKRVLIGTNKYVNKNEKKLGEFERRPDPVLMKDELYIMPVKEDRLSEGLEVERMKKEQSENVQQN